MRLLRAAGALALVTAALTAAAPVASHVVRAAPASCVLCSGGEYQAIPPVRIYDSRPAPFTVNEPAPAPKPIGSPPQQFDIQLVGPTALNVPLGDVLAVVVNITVTEPTIAAYLGAYPKDNAPANPTSIVNFRPGATVPNMAIVRPGTDGMLTISLGSDRSGTAHVIVDVFGYFTTSASSKAAGDGGRLVEWNPVRLADTRVDGGTPGAGGELAVRIRGNAVAGVPDSPDITAAVVNITGVLPSAPTFVSALPNTTGGVAPSTSNLNLLPGMVKANLAIVPIGADGSIRLYNAFGDTSLVVDLFGVIQKNYDAAASVETRTGRVVPLSAPFRAFDTRTMGGALGPGQAEDWSFANFVNSITIGGAPIGDQVAVLGNLTEADQTRQYPTVPAPSFLTVWPPNVGATPPLISNLNFFEGQTVPNMALLKYDGSKVVRVYNLKGFVNYIFDASAIVLS